MHATEINPFTECMTQQTIKQKKTQIKTIIDIKSLKEETLQESKYTKNIINTKY